MVMSNKVSRNRNFEAVSKVGTGGSSKFALFLETTLTWLLRCFYGDKHIDIFLFFFHKNMSFVSHQNHFLR